jgi:hypothetical protein
MLEGEEAMPRLKLVIHVVAIGALFSVVASMATTAAPRRGPGECGEFKYWQQGKCQDARFKPSGRPWTDKLVP